MKAYFSKNILSNNRNLLLIIVIFHFINNVFWFKDNSYGEHAAHAVWLEDRSFQFSEILSDNKLPISKKILGTLDLFKLSHSGYEFTATNFNLTSLFISFPISSSLNGRMKLFLINIILFLQFVMVIFAIYYLGKAVFNQTVGMWSAVILSFYPGIIGASRKVNLELMVAFFVILSVVLFLRWKYLGKIPRLFLLCTVFILGIFSGGLFLVFFIPLAITHLIHDLLSSPRKREGFFLLVIFICIVALFLDFYFDGAYLRIFSNLKDGFREAYQKLFFQSNDFIGSAANGIVESFLFAPQDSICPCTQTTNVGLNIKTFLFYIMEMIYYASPFFFVLAILSLPLFIRDKKIDFYKRIFIMLWIGSGYLLLTLFHIKWGKFIIPLLPGLALNTGIFISEHLKKMNKKGIIIVSLGISTALYYSYLSSPVPSNHFLEKLNERIIAHHPVKSKFVHIAEQVAAKINDEKDRPTEIVNLAFLDKEALRFRGDWVADQSKQLNNLIRIFLKRGYDIKDFWSSSDRFYNILDRQDFVILITQHRIKEGEAYLYEDPAKAVSGLNFEIVYEDWIKGGVFIYLIKILKI